jgi:Fe-Mn family superoxide dismutase
MFKAIELPYSTNALEPYYSQETLNIHYNLYKGYVENLNKVEDKLKSAREENNYENIKCLEKDLSFFGSGMILHQLFFTNMAMPMSGRPNEKLMFQINKDFGNFNNFKNQFNEAAKVVEASGWCLLVWVPMMNKLEVLQCEKHQNLTLWGCKPILIIDMWEHSYFLQYRSNRANYINAFWNIINWNVVNRRFENIV